MADIFISHSGQDTEAAAALGERIRRERPTWSLFYDKDNIRAGQRWQERLREELQSCRVVLVLLSRNGSRLRFGSYLGGSGEDASVGAGSWLDGRGNWFIPGATDSADFPVTPGAFQTANAGGCDVFLVKINREKRHTGSGQPTASDTAQAGGSGARTGLARDRMARRR